MNRTGKVVKNELVQHFLVWAKRWYGQGDNSLMDILKIQTILYELAMPTEPSEIRSYIKNLWKSIAEEGIYLGGFLDGINYDGLFAEMSICPDNIIRGLRNCCVHQFDRRDDWIPKELFVKNFLSFNSKCQLCTTIEGGIEKPALLNKNGFCENEKCGFFTYQQWELKGLEGHARKKELTPFTEEAQ